MSGRRAGARKPQPEGYIPVYYTDDVGPGKPESTYIPWRCPVCGGCGSVPHDFYMRLGASTGTFRELCRSCNGSGIVWGAP